MTLNKVLLPSVVQYWTPLDWSYPPEEQDLPVYIVDVSLDDDEVAGNHNYQNVSRVPAEKDTQYQKKCIITFIGTTHLFMFKIT